MATAKDLIVKPISREDANRVVCSLHYSHKVVKNSSVHLGVFLDGRCGGALQFGPSLDKRKTSGLVTGTKWHEFLELNRMVLADWLPRNGESRVIGYSLRWLKKTYPWLKWIISFADGTQCGDGTIYRACGFVLTGINKNATIWQLDGKIITGVGFRTSSDRQKYLTSRGINRLLAPDGGSNMRQIKAFGGVPLCGWQLRYIYFIDPAARENLTVPILPFDEIARRGAGMYKGQPARQA